MCLDRGSRRLPLRHVALDESDFISSVGTRDRDAAPHRSGADHCDSVDRRRLRARIQTANLPYGTFGEKERAERLRLFPRDQSKKEGPLRLHSAIEISLDCHGECFDACLACARCAASSVGRSGNLG